MNATAAAPQSLARLLDGIAALPRDVAVSDLTQDGRAARPGGAFLAVHGSVEHGLKYAPQAIANGARAVLWEPAPVAVVPDLPSEILVAPVPRLREHASTIADRFFGAPSARLAVAGITGTNGKTTCAYLLAQALERCGRPAAYMGTIGTGRPRQPGRERAHHRRRHHRAAHAGQPARRRRHQRGDGSFLARARPGARGRGAVPHRRVHQSHARSSRLSRHHGELRRRQGPAVHARRPRVARDQRRRRVRPPARHRSARPRPRHRHEPRPPVAHAQRGGLRARHARHAVGARHRARIRLELGHGRRSCVRWSATSTSTTC